MKVLSPPTTKDKTKMKSAELRIGNWINLTKDDFKTVKPYQLDGIDIYKLDESNCADIAPIELTEDWLKRLGFKKFGRNDLPRTLSYKKDWISVFPANSFSDFKGYGFMYYKKEFAGSVESARTVIEYVHQLQNLFHSLTGSELEIK